MAANINIGKILGIPVGLHISWFLIFGLLTWSLAMGFFPQAYPQISTTAHWILGLITSLLFFGSVLAHELGHSIIALREKVPVKGITLFIFGGVAQIGQEPRTPGAEFRIAIAGPIVSFGLAILFGGIFLLDQAIPLLAAPSEYLARINLMLALFNLIPGFPLDGGRVLRSIVWKISNNFQSATQIASVSGQIVAFGFIGLGVLTILGGQFFNGLWLVFIGWFLQNAAASTYAQVNLQTSLEGIRVRQVMRQDCPAVPTLLPLSQLVEEKILIGGQRCFFVTENGILQGMLTLRDIAQIPQQQWRFTTTGKAMVPVNRLVSVRPDTTLLEALQTMDNANVNQLPVLENNELIGMLSRDQVLHYLRVRAELGI